MERRLIGKLLAGMVLLACALASGPGRPAESAALSDSQGKTRLRRPAALAWAGTRPYLLVANQRSGSISAIDTTTLKVVTEVDVGRSISDLAAIGDGEHLLALDEKANELLLISSQGAQLTVAQRLPVSAAPMRVRVSSDGTHAYVASL